MSTGILAMGITHRTTHADLLERVAAADASALLRDLLGRAHIGEAVVLSTCNRVDVYAGVSDLQRAPLEVAEVLGHDSGVDADTLAARLRVRTDDEAVRHVYRVAAGLDSMIVGDAQILGQLRGAYALAAEHDAVGRSLHRLMQQALRVGKRVRTETGIDVAGRDMVTAALDLGLARAGIALDAARALVVGAGAMGGLALATLRRAGVRDRIVANRSAARADRLAVEHDATAITMSSCAAALRHVDLLVVATSSTEPVLTAADLPPVRERPLLILDLGLPRDVDPAVGDVPGVTLVDIASMRDAVAAPDGVDVAAAEAMIAEEAAAFRRQLSGLDAGPTVVALRARADDVIATELAVLHRRRPDLSDAQRADVARTVHRVVLRLLHPPIVRARERAAAPDGDRYSALIRELFDLSSG